MHTGIYTMSKRAVCIRAFSPFQWKLSKLCEVGLTRFSVDKHDLFLRKLDRFLWKQNEQVRPFFFFFPLVLLTVAEEEDCCLCVSAADPLGIIKEYC